ncbi:Dabb family protein [Paenibacillus sp. IHBB 10380]|uniref:Dabb family protein n=1 Tax=Paenibacillus sp. IHBB 10380 TaxID=1566358 RepID=UPI0005CFA677|nr:Dabb family protein [Paenibacillus sp. IHBB 10380]AJS59471.1 stress responsive protein [Paenibacillus sp. IHBB 10380]
MIKHIVLFKLKDSSLESIDKTVNILRNMQGKIPELLSLEVGVDVVRSERAYDIALVTEVESLETLDAYQIHPVHQQVILHMNEAKEHSISVDYEI